MNLTDLIEMIRENTLRTFAAARSEGGRVPNLVLVTVPDLPQGLGLVPFMVFGDTDLTVEVVRMAVAGTAADAVAVVSDTWHAKVRENPDTGQLWRRGEMSDYIENHGRDSLIMEAALITAHTRDGRCRAKVLPYEIKSDGLWWSEQIDLDAPEGRVPEEIRRAFKAPTFASLHPEDPPAVCAMVAVRAIADMPGIELAEVEYGP